MRMSAGQSRDLNPVVEGDPQQAAREVMGGKSGAQFAMYAELAAQLAGAGDAATQSYAAYGAALAIAGQMESDLADVLDEASDDLRGGKVTYPIATALARLEGGDRDALVRLLGEARSDPTAQEAVRDRLQGSGALIQTALAIQVEVRRATSALDAADAHGPAADELRRMAREASVLPSGVAARR